MLVTISGLPGSGTTTAAGLLAEKYDLELVSAGDVFRTLAREKDMTLAEFGRLAESDPSIDLMIDERQKEIALTGDNIILEGRLAGHMADNSQSFCLSFWLKAPREERVRRIVQREGSSYDVRLAETVEREASEALRYQEIYSIDINDLSVYDLVIDSGRWGPESIVAIMGAAIDSLGGFS
jgi:cytidylate kinase